MSGAEFQGQLSGQVVNWGIWLSIAKIRGMKWFIPAALLGWSEIIYQIEVTHGEQNNCLQLHVPLPSLLRRPSLLGSTEAVEEMLMTRAGSRLFESLARSSVSL